MSGLLEHQRTIDLYEVAEHLPEGSETVVRVSVHDADGKELWRSKRMDAGSVRIVVHEVNPVREVEPSEPEPSQDHACKLPWWAGGARPPEPIPDTEKNIIQTVVKTREKGVF